LKYLRPAVESVFSQSFSDWELLVADDGSAQETQAYLRSLSQLPRVTIIWLPHTGIPAIVRNAALSKASGEFVAFLDSDDLWQERKLEVQLAALRTRSPCQWSYTAFTNVDEHGEALPTEAQRRWVPYEGEIFERMLNGDVALRTPCVLATRRLLIAAGAFDETIRSAEDYDLWYRLALRSEIAVVDESLTQIRSHPENHSADWASAYAGQDHTFAKLQHLVDRRRRDLLRRERSRNVLRLALGHAVKRNRVSMFRTLLNGISFSWHYIEWWLRTPRVVMRAFIPERALAMYRRRHGRSA
jgi:glycosyltransferase involved in cell wall biosynthesis